MTQANRSSLPVVLPFNPLDKRNLASSVAEAMLSSPARPMENLAPFFGAGIYAIYYCGKLDMDHHLNLLLKVIITQ